MKQEDMNLLSNSFKIKIGLFLAPFIRYTYLSPIFCLFYGVILTAFMYGILNGIFFFIIHSSLIAFMFWISGSIAFSTLVRMYRNHIKYFSSVDIQLGLNNYGRYLRVRWNFKNKTVDKMVDRLKKDIKLNLK